MMAMNLQNVITSGDSSLGRCTAEDGTSATAPGRSRSTRMQSVSMGNYPAMGISSAIVGD